MAFSFYQSLRTVPTELIEASRSFRLTPVDEFLAPRGAVRDAAAHLEHDDVDVGRLVLRRRLGGDQRRQHHGHAARRRLLHRARHRAAESGGGRLGDRHDADRDPDLRPAAVPAAGRVGRPLPLRAGSRRRGAAILGARHAAPLAASSTALTQPFVVAVAAFAANALVRPTPPRSSRSRGTRRSLDRALWAAVVFVARRGRVRAGGALRHRRTSARRRRHDAAARPGDAHAASSC